MDKLAEEILEEVRAHPGREFYPSDLLHLQSPADIEMQMMWLYENGYVGGDIYSPTVTGIPSTIKIKYIVYHGD